MAIFICINIWAKCPHIVRYAGGVYCTSDSTWPFLFFYGLAERREVKRSLNKAWQGQGLNPQRKEVIAWASLNKKI